MYDSGKHSEGSDAARRQLLKLFSCETPLYGALNRANQRRDSSAVDTLGAYGSLLCLSVNDPPTRNKEVQAQLAREQKAKQTGQRVEEVEELGIKDRTTLYRGLGLPPKAIKTYFQLLKSQKEFAFTAFTSTSLEREVGLKFAH